ANAVAVKCAEKNFTEAQVKAEAVCTHLTDGIAEEFDIVLANPPFHQGIDTDYSFPGRILDAAIRCLKPNGVLYLVANQFLDYFSKGNKIFTKIMTLTRENGY